MFSKSSLNNRFKWLEWLEPINSTIWETMAIVFSKGIPWQNASNTFRRKINIIPALIKQWHVNQYRLQLKNYLLYHWKIFSMISDKKMVCKWSSYFVFSDLSWPLFSTSVPLQSCASLTLRIKTHWEIKKNEVFETWKFSSSNFINSNYIYYRIVELYLVNFANQYSR